MSFNGLRLKYGYEGNSNYISWKDMMDIVLEDKRLKAFLDFDVLQPTTTYSQLLHACKKNVVKVRRILLEGF